METYFQGQSIGAVASADVNPYRFVKNTATEPESLRVAQAGAGEVPLGISADDVESGDVLNVYYNGVGRLDVDNTAAITVANGYIKSGANGIGAAATGGNAYFARLIDPVEERASSEDAPARVRVKLETGTVPQ